MDSRDYREAKRHLRRFGNSLRRLTKKGDIQSVTFLIEKMEILIYAAGQGLGVDTDRIRKAISVYENFKRLDA